MDQLKPGGELDALIAEKVMGYHCVCKEPPGRVDCPVHCSEDPYTLRPYSTDIAAAWEVVEKLRSDDWDFSIHNNVGADTPSGRDSQWWACFNTSTDFDGLSESPAHAICLAALKTVGS